jgi:hypothetical protein
MKMKEVKKKMLAVFMTLAMVLSVLSVLNFMPTVSAAYAWNAGIPGVTLWEDGNTTIGNDPLSTSTKDLTYGKKVTIIANPNPTAGWVADKWYYLYFPIYDGEQGSTAYNLIWSKYNVAGFKGGQAGDYSFDDVTLNVSGLWVIDDNSPATGATFKNITNLEATVAAWFWVNTSVDYTITLGSNEWTYNSSGAFTCDVKDSVGNAPSMIDIRYMNTTLPSIFSYNRYHSDGAIVSADKIWKNSTYFEWVGNYTVYAYLDVPSTGHTATTYRENNHDDADGEHGYYNETYGANSVRKGGATWLAAATKYCYNISGPWNPPEKNASSGVAAAKILVTPGELVTSIPVANQTMYWNFTGDMNISVDDISGDPIPSNLLNYRVVNKAGNDVTSNLSITKGNGYLRLTNNTGGWGKSSTGYVWGRNGSWYVYIWVDTNGDRTETNKEWTEELNASVEFTVAAAPGTQFKWTDDDGTYFTGYDNDGVIPSIPPIANVPLAIDFQIIGDDHIYFGAASETVAKENMTLTGNAIFTGTLDKIPGVSYAGGTWTVPVIPTMSQNGGSIRIDYTWKTAAKNYGTGYATLSIGGTKYYTNGTVVTVDTSEFYIDTPQTFTLTVTDADGSSNKYGTAYLYYIGDTDGGTLGDPIQAHMISIDNGYDGYTLGFNTSQQRHNQTHAFSIADTAVKAPRNLTVYVVASVGTTTTYGYALVQMKPKNALKVHAEAIGAKTTLMSGYEYSKFYINTTIAGINTTTYPTTADEAQMEVRIFDESGTDVTNSLGTYWDPTFAGQIDDDYTVRLLDAYFTKAGEYHVYAYNNTATSEGNNGTLVIKQVAVDTTFADGKGGDFIWKHDDNISATFAVTYEGLPVDGTLRIDNISDANTKYNRTWANTSFDGSSDHGGTLGNTSIDADIVDGLITINDITADYLPAGVSDKDITFWFKPTDSTVYARASGIVKVTVPTVTPDKERISLTDTTKVVVYVTGRESAKLDGVFVRLHGQGYDKNGTSSEGKVTFSVNPSSTGNISIDVGEAGRTVETNIRVVDWTLVVTTNPLTQVNEGMDFTVTVTDKDTGLAVAGVDVAFNGEIPTTDSTGTVTFTAPDVTSDSTLGIIVTAEGYPEATASIKVIYVPKLDISVDETVVAESTFEVTVSRDGNALIGATVTFEGKTYKTKASGVVTLTAPTTVGDYTITASFGTLEPITTTITVTKKTGGIPGFELVTLIAAIGVALILLRRKRN